MSRWLGPVAGIAAGLGRAARLSHRGLSESFGSLLLLLLLVGGGIFVVRALLARNGRPASARYGPQPAAAGADPFARVEPAVRSGMEAAWGGGSAAGAAGTTARRYPPGFDPGPFAAEAKRQFLRLQEAYDRGSVQDLADVLTPQMQQEIHQEIAERGTHVATEVVSVNADVLEVATEGNEHWASVRFTGLTREDGRTTPEPFDEVWNLVKPVNGAFGWRLAGIQQYA
jgi:predicted lipid-binding transport protein (Tim44 family)